MTDLNRGLRLTNHQVQQSVSEARQLLGDEKQYVVALLSGGVTDAILWLAALSGGHRFIPVSSELTPSEAEQLIDVSQATAVIGTLAQAQNWTPRQGIKHWGIEEFDSCIDQSTTDKRAAEVLADGPSGGEVQLSTSGSTGKPKRLVLSEAILLQSARQIAAVHELSTSDRGMTVLPLFHVNAPVVSLLASLVSGGEVQIAKKHSSSQFWNWVSEYQPTWISLVPAVASMLLERAGDSRPQLPQSVRFVRSASAPLAAATLERFESTFGLPLIETYGISEAAATIASNPLPPAAHKAASVGHPVPGLTMRICASGSLEQMPVGQVGEVCIQGPSVIDHYEDGAGSDSFQEGWFRTGDLGYFDEDGYLFLVGRSKDLIIRGGENIFPVEIESVLLSFPGVTEAAVVGLADELYGEAVGAFITTNNAFDLAQLKVYLAEHLSASKIPTQITVLDAMPRTRSNKIDKVQLRKS